MKEISKQQVILKCHNSRAMTWDVVDINLMNQNKNFTDCSRDYCDYECYSDTNIVVLSDKINKNWKSVKNTINKVLKDEKLYEIAFNKKGFCMIVEPIFKGEEVIVGD